MASPRSRSPASPASPASRHRLQDLYQPIDSLSPSSSPSLTPPQLFSKRIHSFTSSSSLLALDSPYIGAGRPLSFGDQYSLSPDPSTWNAHLTPEFKEDDDELHAPEPKERRMLVERDGHVVSWRGFVNLGSLIFICVGWVALFAGYPLIYHFTSRRWSNLGAFNIGGTNGTGQVPVMPWSFAVIDPDTPRDAYSKPSWNDPTVSMELVFSDEFNVDGRTFYPGDDPYWEAVDLHYWATNNLEWYDPAAITTQDGNLVITLEQKLTHDLNYQGGMMSTWNKFCFTGGYIEANVSLPGLNNVAGLWPAIWTMGNLGRAGYGASLEGMWPYTYDACDVGTVANQSVNGVPPAASVNGDQGYDGVLSYLPGQKLSRCTCRDANKNSQGLLVHPGPRHNDGSFVGRSAPEIDMFEAQVGGVPPGEVSQSAQWAPFNAGYVWYNTTENEVIVDPTISRQNSYTGGITQQAASVVTKVDQNCYEGVAGCFSIYGFEYVPGFDNAYITWVSDNKVSWTLNAAGMAADPLVQISDRPISQEPMYILVNLGMSHNFGEVDLAHIPFPVHLKVDYIRVYQRSDQKNIGCNPKGFPTSDYINQYIEAYTNPNLTTWKDDYGQPFPGNSFLGQCSN